MFLKKPGGCNAHPGTILFRSPDSRRAPQVQAISWNNVRNAGGNIFRLAADVTAFPRRAVYPDPGWVAAVNETGSQGKVILRQLAFIGCYVRLKHMCGLTAQCLGLVRCKGVETVNRSVDDKISRVRLDLSPSATGRRHPYPTVYVQKCQIRKFVSPHVIPAAQRIQCLDTLLDRSRLLELLLGRHRHHPPAQVVRYAAQPSACRGNGPLQLPPIALPAHVAHTRRRTRAHLKIRACRRLFWRIDQVRPMAKGKCRSQRRHIPACRFARGKWPKDMLARR